MIPKELKGVLKEIYSENLFIVCVVISCILSGITALIMFGDDPVNERENPIERQLENILEADRLHIAQWHYKHFH